MHFQNFFYFQLIVASYANNTDIIRDYFIFKNVSRVAGFSCGEIEHDRRIIKLLNDAGIAVSISQLNSTIDVERFLHTKYWNLGIFLDLQCWVSNVDVVKIFYEASSYHMFDHLHQWLILGKDINTSVQLLNDSVFSIITDFVIAIPRNDDYILYDVYNHCKPCGGLLNITTFGTWTRNDGLNIILRTNKFYRRWNYNKMKVRTAGIVLNRPKNQSLDNYLREPNPIRVDNWSKFGYSIMVHVADMFNFTFELMELNHWSNNQTQGPLLGGLNEGKFDVGYLPSTMTTERVKIAGTITQVWPMRTCFMFRTIPSSKMDIHIIIKPFAKKVWYMILLLVIIIMLTLWVILKLEKDNEDTDHGETVLIILAALCQQGLPFFSKQFASRVAFLQTMIFGLLVYNYYSAAIVSSRLNIPLDKMNDSLYSLVKSKMKLSAHKDIYFNIIVRFPTEEIRYFKKHWDTIPEEKKFLALPDGIKRITKPGFAYHADPLNIYPTIERVFDQQMLCQLTEVHLLRPSSLALWSIRHGQFQEIVKIGIIKISTSGIRRREVIRWSYKKPYCDTDRPYVSSVTIYESLPIILVLLFGIVLSVVICFIENIVFRMLQKNQEQIKVPKQRSDKFNRKIMVPGSKVVAKTKMPVINKKM